MARSATVVVGVGKRAALVAAVRSAVIPAAVAAAVGEEARAGLAAAVGSTEMEAALAMAERLRLGEQLWLTAWGSKEG